jgi:dTMP kinase
MGGFRPLYGFNPRLSGVEIAGDFEPDLTLLLDVPVATSMARVNKRGGWNDRYQLKPAPFHRKLRKAYLALAKKYPARIKIVDAGGSANEVATSIQSVVAKFMRIK